MLGWLSRNECELSRTTSKRLPNLRAQVQDWNDAWELTADHSMDGRTGWVSIKDDPGNIIDLPISETIAAAEQNSTRPFMEFTEYRPFNGLVKQRPQRALAALAFQARRNNFPLRAWETALAEWPTGLPSRLQWLFAERLSRVPSNLLGEIAHYASQWLKRILPTLAQIDPNRALRVWDSVLIGLTAGGADALKSGVGDTFVGGKPQGYSRRTYTHAINGPVGVMTETLYQILDDRKIGHQASIPIDIRSRIENALSTLGEGEDHAVCETTSRLTWLYYLDPNWVKLRIIPFFALTNDQAEPAWNGFLHNQRLGDTELFLRC